jgi:hypothetical protein
MFIRTLDGLAAAGMVFGLTFSGSTPLGIIVLAESDAVQQLG